MDFLDKIEIISKFYKDSNINIDINEIVNSGILDIKIPIIENEKNDYFCFGKNYYLQNFKSITVYNNGLLTDSIIWVHEISHYRNQPDIKRTQENNLLTESLAFTEELIYIDYLKTFGFEYEANGFQYLLFENFHHNLSKAYKLLKIYVLYNQTGKVSEENYKFLYKNSYEYDYFIRKFNKMIKNNQNAIFVSVWYLLASMLSIYMYISYKNNKEFIEKIKLLNDTLNELSFEKCLNMIDLNAYDGNYFNEENIHKITFAFEQYKDELRTFLKTKDR